MDKKGISNQDKFTQYAAEYRSRPENKEKQREYMQEKVRCDVCNIEMARSGIYRHFKTNKHKKNEEKNTQILNNEVAKELKDIREKLNELAINKDIFIRLPGLIDHIVNLPGYGEDLPKKVNVECSI